MKYIQQHEVILNMAAEAVNKATHCLMTLDLALINFDHKNAQREIGNLQEELSTLKKYIEALRGGE
jgi:hypothetical protein